MVKFDIVRRSAVAVWAGRIHPGECPKGSAILIQATEQDQHQHRCLSPFSTLTATFPGGVMGRRNAGQACEVRHEVVTLLRGLAMISEARGDERSQTVDVVLSLVLIDSFKTLSVAW